MSMSMTDRPAVVDVESPLMAAQRALAEARSASSAISMPDHERRITAAAEGVVDHVRRVTLPTASPHYQADKAGPLVAAALSLQAAAFDGYAADQADAYGIAGREDLADELLSSLADGVTVAVEASRAVCWDVARAGVPSTTSAEALRSAAHVLTGLVRTVWAIAQDMEG